MVAQSQSLVLRQSQNLVMTQSMQQSLKILQLSSQDLANYIETELEKNPLLEIDGENDKEAESTSDKERKQDNTDSISDSFENLTSDNIKNNETALDADMNSSWNSSEESNSAKDNEYDYSNNYTQGSGTSGEDDAGTIIEKTYSEEPTLKEYVMDQVTVDFTDPKDKIIAEHVIDMVDPSGYLSSPTLQEDLVSLSTQLGCTVNDINDVIAKLQKLDPLGICSRNLKEYLKIQLEAKETLDPALEKLVDNIEMLAKAELDKLKKICAVEMEDLMEMIKEIKILNPRPASGFSQDKPQTKHSDLIIEKKNGIWELELNQELFPKVNVRKDYYKQVKTNRLKQDEKKFISENYTSANFLIRAIEQRAITMLRVGDAIMKHQEAFLEKGINYLKPISMREIAAEVELHESTIGRVVANKYISTPRGVYELKYFFTNALGSTQNDTEFSSETVKYQVHELINNETKVLSDDEIAGILKLRGINIARRTVAKYREAMNIPTSAVRKRMKKIDVA